VVSYLLAQFFLFLHLWHGGSSWFQSLGLNRKKSAHLVSLVGPGIALVVLVGNCLIPLAILFSSLMGYEWY
jgi:succinate dehydrogenase / fumarate reductase cytochrome b subunit